MPSFTARTSCRTRRPVGNVFFFLCVSDFTFKVKSCKPLLSFLHTAQLRYVTEGTCNNIIMMEKMLSCSQLPKWIIISALFNTDIKRLPLFPEVHLLVSELSFLLVFPFFPHCFQGDNKLLSCATTGLTQRDLPGVELFWKKIFFLPSEMLHLHNKKKTQEPFLRHVWLNWLIRTAGYRSHCVLICFSQCRGSVSLYSLLAAND